MRAFRAIVAFEVRSYLRRISTWVYFTIFFAIAFLFMLATGGAWEQVNAALGSGGKVFANAPYALASLIPVLSFVGVSITAALAGNALYKDYESHTEPLFYTTPVSRAAFLGGRFTASLIINVLVTTGIGLGAFAATISPWVHADKIGAFRAMAYVQPYLVLVLPNLVLTAAIFFALVAMTRQMLPNYVGGALLLIGYLLAGTLVSDVESKTLGSLVDPFGLRAQAALTQYWSIAEKNTRLVPLSGELLANRILWLAVAVAILMLAYVQFRFSYAAGDRSALAGPAATAPAVEEPALPETVAAERLVAPLRTTALPPTARHFDVAARWLQFRSVFSRSFWGIVRSRYFGVIVGGGLLYLVVAARAVGRLYGTTTWPVTYQMESLLSGSFGAFIIVVIALYAGELVWDERDAGIDQIYYATPVENGVIFGAKFTALVAMILVLLATTMVAGILMQASRGYYHFEIPLYLQALFGFRFADYLLFAALAMAVHVLVNHKYLGHFLVILLFLGSGLVAAFGLQDNLYQYASDAGSVYSDMNRWGPYAWPFIWWKLYWGAFAGLLLVVASLFWVRGGKAAFDARAREARRRFPGAARRASVACGILFVAVGVFIYYNTHILNTFRSDRAERRLRAERERLYKRFEHVPQPRIAAVTLQVDLSPAAGSAALTGRAVLQNRTGTPIDSIHVGLDADLDLRQLAFDRPATRVLSDREHEYAIYRLERPLAPGDSLVMRFAIDLVKRGFPNEIGPGNLAVVGNGTFLENVAFMPHIGYDARQELQDDEARKKERLPPREPMPPPSDPSVRASNYLGGDADWIRYDATISTDPDQLAITSGYLQREWVAGGRRYFHYTMDAPILDLWAFQSARYAVKRGRWHDVDLEIDYHPTHTYDLDRMMVAMQRSLDYYTANFAPYQFHQLRIVEFPRYEAFAQSLPNTIPFSEALGFIARVESPEDVDYPFYVTAHEVSHQWWAHQLIGADAQGATMLSETLAQYSALMVMEKEFGPANMRKFLEYELNSYLLGRSTERRRELPLEFAENQPYIHYNKGSLVMYAMRDYLGEARMNRAIRGFLQAYRFHGPPYPTSLDLVDSLRVATPDSLKYLIGDLFENITLYELRADSVVANDVPSGLGKYAVDLYVHARKVRADSLGRETEVPMNDWIDIGLFAKAPAIPNPAIDATIGVPLYLAKRRVRSGAQVIRVVVDQVPYRAGIDPLHKLIDRITTDNTVGVRDRSRLNVTRAPGGRGRPATPVPRGPPRR